MLRILLAGSDLHLLETRAAVLSRTGATVVWCSASDAHQFLGKERFDLLVLCHSLPGQEVATLLSHARQEIPEMKILMVASHFDGNASCTDGEVDVAMRPEPERLVARVKELLASIPQVASTSMNL